MNVALVGKSNPVDGLVVYTRQLARQLVAEGDRVIKLHFADYGSPEARSTGRLPHLVRTQGFTLAGPGARGVLRDRLRAEGTDLLHAQLPVSPLDFRLPGITRDLGVGLVGTLHHGWDERLTKFSLAGQAVVRAYAPALARYDRVIVFGPRLQGELVRLGVPPERVAVVPNGVDVAAYSPGPSKHRLQGRLRVTYMGRITSHKHVPALVETFVAAAEPDLVLTLVGTGPLLARLRGRYAGHPGIDFVGFVGDEAERQAIWRGSDVVVLPSPLEGLSLSLLEGMASGCLPVATDVGEHESVLGDVGLVLDPQKVRADLTAAWKWLVANREQVRAGGAAAREHVASNFSSELHWRRLRAVYESTMGEIHG